MSEAGERSGLSRRKRAVAALATGAVVLAGSALWTSTFVKSPAQAAADAGPPAPDVLTAPVERRVLADTVVTRGTVSATQTVDLAPVGAAADGSAAPVVTKVMARSGQTFEAGRVLVEVSGRPVFALPGKLPVYRDLKPGTHGDDVRQLQRALRSLGHSTGSDASGLPASKCVAAVDARCPPAENPHTPTRLGSVPWSFAFARTYRMARCTSSIGAGWSGAGRPSLPAIRYLSRNAVTPRAVSHSATCLPS